MIQHHYPTRKRDTIVDLSLATTHLPTATAYDTSVQEEVRNFGVLVEGQTRYILKMFIIYQQKRKKRNKREERGEAKPNQTSRSINRLARGNALVQPR